MHKWLFLACLILLVLPPGSSQATAPGQTDVFVSYDSDSGSYNIYFVDALSGLSTVVHVDNGWRFTLVGNYVLYEKPQTGSIMRANANGTVEPHPFIWRTPDVQAIHWVTSPDARAIAWVQISTTGVSQAYVAWANGDDFRQLPITSPPTPLVLEPLALTNGITQFFYDTSHSAEPGLSTPFSYYENIGVYNISDEIFGTVPEEPGCPCGAALTSDGRTFARLVSNSGVGPFELHVWDLPTGASIEIPAPDLPYRWAGDLILNSKGTLGVYSASDTNSNTAEALYALILVDMVTRQQYLVLRPGPVRYKPIAFIDDDGALLMVGVTDGATYKLNVVNGELQRVSDETYLGSFTTG